MSWLEEIRFDERGIVPVVTQEVITGEVLMQAYANRDALERTVETGRAHYWSRSRGELWMKGETSGNAQEVVEIRVDCDGDGVLYRVRQTGPACHTGRRSCFYRELDPEDGGLRESTRGAHALARVDEVVARRAAHPKAGSYTNYLLEKGIDKILKKVGEESAEVVIAAKNDSDAELRGEVADLLYHLVVMLRSRNLTLDAVWNELDTRFGRAPRSRTAPPDGRNPEP